MPPWDSGGAYRIPVLPDPAVTVVLARMEAGDNSRETSSTICHSRKLIEIIKYFYFSCSSTGYCTQEAFEALKSGS